MAEETLRDDTTDLASLTLQGVSEIRASLTEEGKVPEDLVLGFNSEDPQFKKASLIQIRTIIQKPSPPEGVQAVLDTGLVPAIVSLLDSEDTCLQFEAAWIVTNLAAGTAQQTEQIIDAGAIPKLIILSASPKADIAENAVWALRNVLGHSVRLRDRVEEEGGVDALVKLVDRGDPSFEKVQKTAVQAIFGYLHPWSSGKLPIEGIERVLSCLVRYIQETPVNEASMEFIEYAVEGLDRIRDHGLQRTDFIASGVVPRLVKLLADPWSTVALQQGVLRCLGYLVSGSNEDMELAINAGLLNNHKDLSPSAQPVLDTGFVPAIVSLLDSEDTRLQCQAARIVMNIASGTTQQTERVIDADAVPRLIILSASPDVDVADYAAWALGNVLGDSVRLRDRVGEGGVAALVKLVDRGDPSFEKVQKTAVQAIFGYLNPWSSGKLPIERIERVLPCLNRYIQETPVNEASMESIEFAVQALVRGGDQGLPRKSLIATGVVPRLVKLLADSSSSIALQDQVLRCLVYVVSGSNDDRDVALSAGLLYIPRDLSLSEAVQPVIDTRLIPAIVSLLDSEDTDLQFKAARIVVNITRGTTQQNEQVIDSGAIPRLIILSASPNASLAINAVSALGNVLGDFVQLRDRVEEAGGVAALVKLVDRGEPSLEGVQRTAVQAIFRYLNPRSPRRLPIARIERVLPCLARYIQETPVNEANMESIEYAVKALDRVRDHGLHGKSFIATGVVSRLVKLLADSSPSITLQKEVLNCLGHLVGGSDDDRDVVVDAGLLPGLLVALETKNPDLCQLALLNALNVAAGSHSQVGAFLDCGLLKSVVRVLTDDQESTKCRRTACWTISNLTKKVSGDAKVAQACIEGRCVEALSAALLIHDRKTKELAVMGITCVLKWKPPQGPEADKSPLTILRSASGPQNLRAVRDSRNVHDETIKIECQSLLDQYFPDCCRPARV